MRDFPIFLLPVKNLTSDSNSLTPISYKSVEILAIRQRLRSFSANFHDPRFNRFHTVPVCDGQTHRQTDGQTFIPITCLQQLLTHLKMTSSQTAALGVVGNNSI